MLQVQLNYAGSEPLIKPTKRWNQVRIRSGSKVVPLKEEISEEVDKKSKRPEELRCDLVTTN